MTNTQIRNVASCITGSPLAKRCVHRLSDGTTLAAVISDSNISTVTGDGGDSSNLWKMYVYTSGDNGVTWTLRYTHASAVAATGSFEFSSCIDSSDNVHLAWIEGGNTKYAKITHASGPAYSLGVATTVYTVAASYTSYRIDIDCFDNGQAVVAVFQSCRVLTGTSNGMRANCYTLSSAGAVVNTKSIQMYTTAIAISGTEDITVSATHDAIVSNVGTYVVLAAVKPNVGSDTGDFIATVQCNLSSGAAVSYTLDARIPMGGKPFRKYMLFCANGARDMIYAVMGTGPNAVMGYRRFTVGSGGAFTYTTGLMTSAIATTLFVPAAPGSTGYNNISFSYMDNTTGVMTYCFGDTNRAYTVVAATYTGYFRTISRYVDQSYSGRPASALEVVAGGKNRNLTAAQVDFVAFYQKAGYSVRYVSPDKPLAPANLKPAAGATVSTDLPALAADYRTTQYDPFGALRMVWKIAQDSAFTTSLKAIVSPNTASPNGCDPAHLIKVTDSIPTFDISNELSQGVWFLDAYTFDEWTQASQTYTAHTGLFPSFTVSHPPAAANQHPNGGQLLVYGTGSIQFNWQFTDPYVNDSQTSYQIQVQDDTSTIVVDTGKLAGTFGVAAVSIPSGSKDTPLQWRVRVWDRDDVQSVNWSDWASFYVSDAPSVTVTVPTSGTVFTTGVTPIEWTNGITGGKTQQSFSVAVTDVVSGLIVHNSGTILSDALIYSLPTGVVHNAHSYIVTVTVTDSLGLTGTSSPSAFSISWTPPAGAGPVYAYLYKYTLDGYVFVGWKGDNIDPAFAAWNLYRRILGDTTWELLEAFPDSSTTYGYRDYAVKSGRIYQYAVTQVIFENGDLVESPITVGVQISAPSSSYWLIDPLGLLNSVPLFGATADKYTNEQETSVYTVIGVGRHVDEGDILGVNGALTLEIRDKVVGLTSSINQFLNPSFQGQAVINTPDGWTISGTGTSGTITTDNLVFYEPAPNNSLSNFVLRSDGLGTGGGDAIILAQAISQDRLPVTPGNGFDHSEWFAVEPVPGNITSAPVVKSKADYYNSSNTLISSETITSTLVDTFEPSGSGDSNTGAWKRYKARHTMPALTDHMVITTLVQITGSSGAYGVVCGGAQLEQFISPFFDGGSRGGHWTGAPYATSSFNTGYYTSSDQLVDIQAMKNVGRPILLKSPFGSSFYVKLTDNDFDRMAGVTAEFGTMNLPYLEVAF